MELVTVKNKFQIVIPRSIREQIEIGVGDMLEAKAENGKITLIPKTALDRHLSEALEDLREGRTHGPYKTAKEAVAALEMRARTRKKR